MKKNKENLTAKKVIHLASTSILATGLAAAPGVTQAQSVTTSSATSTSSYSVSTDQPTVYTGDSIAYFKQQFFKSSSKLTHGESGSVPIARAMSFAVKKSAVLTAQLQASDEDSDDQLTYHIGSQPASGTLTLNANTGDFTYNGASAGTYTFTYYVTDLQNHTSDPATVTIEVKKDKDKDTTSSSSSSTPSTQPQTTTPSSPSTTTTTPTASGTTTIDAVHSGTSTDSARTRGAAVLAPQSSEQQAVLQVLTDQIRQSVSDSQVNKTVMIDASAVKGKQQYQINFSGAVVQSLLSKQNGFAVKTGDVSIYIPSSALNKLVQNEKLNTSDQANWVISAQKVAAPANVAGAVNGTAYQVSVQVASGDQQTTVNDYANRYIQLGVAVPDAAGSSNDYVGMATDTNGNSYVVPVTFDENGNASVHALEGATLQIVKVTAPIANSSDSSQLQLLKQKQIVPQAQQSDVNGNSAMTRGELAQYLASALGINTSQSTGTSSFTDLASNTPETRAIQALSATGILKGISGTEFAPDRVISREQLAVILTRAANVYGLGEGAATSTTTPTTNSAASQWAKAELQQALSDGNASGIVSSGDSALTANPVVTQNEGAATLVRWLQNNQLLNS
ncbi:S-layer homology domain-containing protein [Paenibacillus sp. WLX1005]|uniref:S-layer homology domain-containing protein n=1 Tax=Paenibacillus sp. WLX1005 TaxID=3243766 RepID=UPI0039844C4B